MEGEFSAPESEEIPRGDRAVFKRQTDNLRMDGDFEGRREEYVTARGERVSVVRREDNLRMDGEFTGKEYEFVNRSSLPFRRFFVIWGYEFSIHF